MRIAEATPDQLLDWDDRTVRAAGGNVYQSRAWAEQRARVGWRPRFLVFDDGFRLLSLARPWRYVGGAGAYLSRGPVTAGEPVERTADRLRAAADWLIAGGVDVVASDAEIEAATGYGRLLAARGFHPIEEVQPSRHRVALSLAPGSAEEAQFRDFGESTRQLIRAGEKAGLRVVRWDATLGGGEPGSGFEPPASPDGAPPDPRPAFDRFYDLLVATAERRQFGIGPRRAFVDWSEAGLAAGHVIFLEALAPSGEWLGAATFYRHGGRLTYSHSGDRADLRRANPGVVRLLLWRAIQIALRDGLAEMDLAGVDVRGARREPVEGEPMFGLYAFKRSFGGRWVELAGNHETVARPWRYALGRLTGRLPGGRR
jgi:peptidoglycan pentaglycine glycine transferase (the first glycine)